MLLSAELPLSANRMLALAETLYRDYPGLLFVLDGPGFRASAVARLGKSAIRVGDDARDALAAIERRMPPLKMPKAAEAAEAAPSTDKAPGAASA